MRASSMSFGRRMGTFSLTIGMFLILYFVFSASVALPSVGFLLGGVALAVLGFFLIISHPPPPPTDTGRFRILRPKPSRDSRKKA
jgi:hypothetical protein